MAANELPGCTHIAFVLDRSGSMDSIRDDAIGGFNRFLTDQKAIAGRASLSLIGFDDRYERWCDFADLAGIAALDRNSYVPRGATALLDAIGRTITETIARIEAMPASMRPQKLVFVVLTDGFENASRQHDLTAVNALIARQRDVHGWQFLFLAADKDAIATAAGLGIAANRATTFAKNRGGAEAAFSRLSEKLVSFRECQLDQEASEQLDVTEAEREEQRDHGATH